MYCFLDSHFSVHDCDLILDLNVKESTTRLWEKANTTQVSVFGTEGMPGFTYGGTVAISLILSPLSYVTN